jgi:uncharacterized membrane protein (DUF4010 family)
VDPTLATRLAVALAIGFIIGVERGWQGRQTREGLRTAGVRTFACVGLFGGLASLLADELGAGFLGVALLALAAVVTAAYWLTAREGGDYGTTSEMALLLTFGLGALATRGYESEAVAAAVVVSAILGFKRELHASLERLDRREIAATLQLLVIAAVVLPLLPNRELGPWQALNPRGIGLLVLLIAAISYVGWFLARWLGARAGILLTSLLGGLSSSTAVTVSYARMARRGAGDPALLGAGIALAAGTMAVRLLVVVGAVEGALVPRIAAPLALLAFVPVAAALLVARRSARSTHPAELTLRNPLDLESALAFGALLSVIFLLVRGAQAWLGSAGIYAVAALSGVADVDAVSLSLARSAGGRVSLDVAARGILLAAFVNTAVKGILAGLIGGRALALRCAPILAVALVAGVAASWMCG